MRLYSWCDMKRALKFIFLGSAMFLVAFLTAAITLRLAIHGREVAVPNLQGKSDAEAAKIVSDLGLNLSVENRFYSAAVPANNVLSQSPVAGARVRRGWQVRVTESLGGQHVQVPDVTGQGERPASLVLRRLQLEIGGEVHLPAPGEAGLVLAQSPPPNSAGLTGPRVALLVSDGEDAATVASAYVMPQIVGMTLGAAGSRLATVGLHIASAAVPTATAAATPGIVDPTVDPGSAVPSASAIAAAPATMAPPMDPMMPVQSFTPAPVSVSAVITSQSPAPGRRVTRGDAIRVTLAE